MIERSRRGFFVPLAPNSFLPLCNSRPALSAVERRSPGVLGKNDGRPNDRRIDDDDAERFHGLASPRELFLISFALLFFELTCIRWFGGTVIFLNFFTNLVLMACFLGMSVGCMAASRRFSWTRVVLPLAFATAVVAWFVLVMYQRDKNIIVSVGHGAETSRQIFFGTEFRKHDVAKFVLPIEVVGGFFFVMIALTFVGLGQAMGRAFEPIPNRIAAYSANIAGSLAGIAAFAAVSALGLPPWVWFAVSCGLCLWMIRPPRRQDLVVAAALVGLVAWADYGSRIQKSGVIETSWSPYNKIRYDPDKREIEANNIPHQGMVRFGEAGALYALPHLLNRDSGREPFEEVLVIGAGSGNDVQAALAMGAKHVRRRRNRPGAQPTRPPQPSRQAVFRPARDHPSRRRPAFPTIDHVQIRFDLLRRRRFARSALGILQPALGELSLHRGGPARHQRPTQARRHVGDVQLLPLRLGRRPVDGDGQARLRRSPLGHDHRHQRKYPLSRSDRRERSDQRLFHLCSCRRTRSRRGRVDSAAFRQGRLVLAQRLADPPPVPRRFREGTAAPRNAPEATWHRVVPAKVETFVESRAPTDDWPFLYLREPSIPDLNARWMALLAFLSLVILTAIAPKSGGAAERTDVLPRRGVYALGDQGGGSHGPLVRLDLGRQLGRLRDDPGHDPRGQPSRLGVQAAEALALVRLLVRLVDRVDVHPSRRSFWG